MPVTVKRFGGHLPVAKVNVFELNDLDASTRKALDKLIDAPPAQDAAKRMPDGYTYTFEVDGKDASVPGTKVPDALRKLLP